MLKIKLKKISEEFRLNKNNSKIQHYLKNQEVAEFIFASNKNMLEEEQLLILYEYVSPESRDEILDRLEKSVLGFSAPFELILRQLNLEGMPNRISRLRRELFKTRDFKAIHNYLLNNPSFDDYFRRELTNNLSYALEAIYYLNRNNLKGFIKDIDVNYIEKIIVKDKDVKVLENYISNYKIHDNKELEKILFQIGNTKLIYLYVLKGSYSKEFNRDKAIGFIEASGDLELVIKTAVYLKPENLSNLNAEDFFLSIGLIELPDHEKKKLIDDAYELFSAKRAQEYRDSIVLDKQKQLKNKFIGKNLHN